MRVRRHTLDQNWTTSASSAFAFEVWPVPKTLAFRCVSPGLFAALTPPQCGCPVAFFARAATMRSRASGFSSRCHSFACSQKVSSSRIRFQMLHTYSSVVPTLASGAGVRTRHRRHLTRTRLINGADIPRANCPSGANAQVSCGFEARPKAVPFPSHFFAESKRQLDFF